MLTELVNTVPTGIWLGVVMNTTMECGSFTAREPIDQTLLPEVASGAALKKLALTG